ncbi:MAG: 23S rRNA methyltransferase [Eubacteriales bacterium]|nr:23S rRNA methyltransferase [Eubacteriales bacterium]
MYEEIKACLLKHSGLKAAALHIAQVKARGGIKERERRNHAKSADAKQPVCPAEKEIALRETLKFFGMITL